MDEIKGSSEWTLRTLKEYVDNRFESNEKFYLERMDALTKLIESHSILDSTHFAANKEHYLGLIANLKDSTWERFASQEKAKDAALSTLNNRLESMNEFRRQLDKQGATFVTWPQVASASFAMAVVVTALAELLIRLFKI